MAAEYPFTFPVVARYDDGTVMVHRTGAAAGLCSESDARSGRVPKVEFYDGSGRSWRPLRITEIVLQGKRVFGKVLVRATFAFAPPRSFEFDELCRVVRDAIEQDDDIWNQTMTHSELLAMVDDAATFDELIAALVTAAA